MKPERLRRLEFRRDGGVLAAYDSGGDGMPVVFQHGLCGDIRQVAEAVPDLPALRLISLECRGHGASEAVAPYSIATFTDDIAALIQALGVAPAIVGGISMGAAIATRLAVTRPDLVHGLVLVRPAWVVGNAPHNMAPNAEVGALLRRLPVGEAIAAFRTSPTYAQLVETAPDNLASLDGFFARKPIAVTAELLTAISADGPGISEVDLGALDTPALVLGSWFDAIHPMAHAERLSRLIPGARFNEITPKGVDKSAYISEIHTAFSAFLKELHHA
ncbi:alpha/beta fold hydrolase [Oryzicola mucosus]|uniref:Alpha/beta hydrolase n=1 Tax=Oryzicola mucosus TaxID=2767425 RepID=A0A8J6U4U6_9HYPH|nr:alpha/beta hydrolase [Oryzicola mucosus]MBD0415060.1 alpha/beta hydrolase [Oryzicola mucosus]